MVTVRQHEVIENLDDVSERTLGELEELTFILESDLDGLESSANEALDARSVFPFAMRDDADVKLIC